MQVNSRDTKAYTFEVQIERGRQRLDVAFINDYYKPPENRDLWVEQAKIIYTRLLGAEMNQGG